MAQSERIACDSRVQTAIDRVVVDNLGPVTVTQLAQAAGLLVSYFAHLFARDFGISPSRFVRERRVREAEILIRTTRLSLKEILGRLGVSDRSHFTRTFKRRFGLSPSKDRVETQRSEGGQMDETGESSRHGSVLEKRANE